MKNITYISLNPKFKVGYIPSKREYLSYNVSSYNAKPDLVITDDFIFEDTLKLSKVMYKNHVELESLIGNKFIMSSGKFSDMLLSGKYTSLDPDGKLLFTGRFSFRKIGCSVYLYPVDI